jgi:hypothetical protein
MIAAWPMLSRLSVIFDGFVVEQAVHRLGLGLGIHLVHGAAEFYPPVGKRQREIHVQRHRRERQRGIAPVEQRPQKDRDQQQLEDGRDDIEHGQPQHALDAFGAAIHRAGKSTGLAVEMEAQRQTVQVPEGLERHDAHGALLHAGKHRVAEFGKPGGGDAQQAIAGNQRYRQCQHRPVLRRQRVDRVAVDQRHIYGGDFCRDQEHRRDDDAQMRGMLALRPKIRQQGADGGEGRPLGPQHQRRAGAGSGTGHGSDVAWRGRRAKGFGCHPDC